MATFTMAHNHMGNRYAVIGVGFGDEGKGRVVDQLTRTVFKNIKHSVVRYSGGHQAGHTVFDATTGAQHVFSHIPSGYFNNSNLIWGEKCTIYPTAFVREYLLLTRKAISNSTFEFSLNSPITTPFDLFAQRSNALNRSHGTCGSGFGTTLQREQDHYSLIAKDLFNKTVLMIKLQQILQYYGYPNSIDYYIDTMPDVKEFIAAIDYLVKLTENNTFIFNNRNYLKNHNSRAEEIIFESSQGLLLDQEYGFFPNVTRSKLGLNAFSEEALRDITPIYVTRAYQTRHGNGPMTNEEYDSENSRIKIPSTETNTPNEFQGDFRSTILDIDLIKYAIERDCPATKLYDLAITCLDHLSAPYYFTINRVLKSCSTKDELIQTIINHISRRCIHVYASNNVNGDMF
jgi:adenylosuccinate synthase